ncbi:hypothetical protein B0H14DRAFT_1303315 [Mycena olivaceomarginata]|nr:hypothetical protein B0H14DRAFT_1303315 [Mycena olivaceomarginata]
MTATSHSSPRRRQRRACLLLLALASGLFLLIGSSYVYFAPSAPPQLRPLHQRPLDGHRGPAPAPLPPPHGHGENAPHPPTHGDGMYPQPRPCQATPRRSMPILPWTWRLPHPTTFTHWLKTH